MRGRTSVLFVALAALAVAGMPAAQAPCDRNVKLNGPLVATELRGTLDEFEISPDGTQVVYRADQDIEGLKELYVVPADGSAAAVKLSGPAGLQGEVLPGIQISPDGARVVYHTQGQSSFELYSAPMDGSELPVRLHPDLVPGGSVGSFRISPDGGTVIYGADQDTNEQFELYSVPIDGSAVATKLSGTLPSYSDVASAEISPDSQRAVYRVDAVQNEVFEVFSVPLDGSTAPIRLNNVLVLGRTVTQFRISADSNRVVYRADKDIDDAFELYSVPIGGGAVVKLNSPFTTDQDVVEFVITPDSETVVYRADQNVDDIIALFSVPVDGSASPTRLNDALSPLNDVTSFALSPDGSRVAYVAGATIFLIQQLYSVPIDRSLPPVQLNPPYTTSGDVVDSIQISPDGSRVVYVGRASSSEPYDLFSVPIDGSPGNVKLNDPFVAGGAIHGLPVHSGEGYLISPDGSRVVYHADQDTNDVFELYSVPLDGTASPVKLNAPLAPNEDVATDFEITADNARVVFRVGSGFFDQNAFSVPLEGGLPPVEVNEGLAPDLVGDVRSYEVAAAGDRVVYRADQVDPMGAELYGVPVDGSQGAVRLSGPELVREEFLVSPDGVWAVYTADLDVYSVPTDGSLAAVKLNPPPIGPTTSVPLVTPDSSHVVYLSPLDSNLRELYRVPIEGGPSIKLNGPLVSGGSVSNHELSPDGLRVVYRADQETDGLHELFSGPVDASEAPVKISGLLQSTDTILGFEVDPTSSWVVYRADPGTTFEIFSVPLTGGAVSKLNGPVDPGGSIDVFRISPDGTRVVYWGDETMDGVEELYSAPIDGSGPSVKLNGPLVTGGRVFTSYFVISPDSSRVVYLANQESTLLSELYSAPIDGSTAPVKLNGRLEPDGDVFTGFLVSPDSSRVVYRADQDTNTQRELYSVPLDGSASPIKLNGPLPVAGSVSVRGLFRISPDGTRVLYAAPQETQGVNELYVVPLDGSAPSRKVSGPLVLGGDVSDEEGDPALAFSPDSRHALYLADQDRDEMFELFATELAPRIDAVLPNTGPFAGGNTIRVLGCGFTPETSVLGVAPANVTFVSETELEVVVPPSPSVPPTTKGPGAGKLRQGRIEGVTIDVTVSDLGLQSTLEGGYTYLPIR